MATIAARALDFCALGAIVSKYVNELVEVYIGCDGVNIQNNYKAYVNYRRVTNAKETVGGFLWGTAIMEKPTKAVVTP